MAERVPSVSLAQAQPGDLLIIDSDNNTEADHVQVYQGNGRVIQATGAGVNEANADWSHVTKVVRPSLLQPTATYDSSAVAGNVNALWQQALQGAGSNAVTSIGNI
jgi:cell wall-associated NlpC family hydrolase